MTSYEHHGGLSHQKRDCFFDSLIRIENKGNIEAPHYMLYCEGNAPVIDGFPLQGDSNAESVSMMFAVVNWNEFAHWHNEWLHLVFRVGSQSAI